jgi:hypothetical protein
MSHLAQRCCLLVPPVSPHPFWQVRRWGLLFAKLLGQPYKVCEMHLREDPPQSA